MELSKEDIFEEELSPEEKTYTTAVELMDAIDCVERFEQVVFSLRSATEKFEQLGDYKDAKKLGQECRAKADKLEKKGCEETLQRAEEMSHEAKTKSDFIAVSSEYRRLKKFDDYKERGATGEAFCQKEIKKIETRKVYKRWIILLAVLTVLTVVVVETPLLFVAKGVVHEIQGDYQAAINCYKQVDYLPGADWLERSCHYKKGQKFAYKYRNQKAMKEFYKAGSYANAENLTTRYQKRFIRKAQIGDTVFYAGKNWVVLENQTLENRALLIKKGALNEDKLPNGGKVEEEELLAYLNEDYITDNFSDMEQVMMGKEIPPKKRAGTEVVQTEPDQIVESPVFILPDSVWDSYQDILPEDWDSEGVHPAVWVNAQK